MNCIFRVFKFQCFLASWFLINVFCLSAFSQQSKSDQLVYVDNKGVMRWSGSKEEVRGFGVNYTVPFAHAYRSAKKLGVSHKEAIDQDVYHFARLGFDAYRVHVWDTEISDSTGNLLDNDHLQLFDYMLKQMKERGMKFILTPIAFWGNGYPEPEEKTPGFARKYGKAECLVNEDAIKAQEKYLYQFLNHVNPHTGVAYKNDPDIIAFEISNEPHHHESPEKVTRYIDRMVAAIRRTKCKKPIFYNISHSIHLVNAYFNAEIQGGTFQWYPTGLGAQEELGGNLLPNVDRYEIPFAYNPRFKKSAKIVYEFDAADVGRSYIYPAMARSFRTAGIQWAAHFSYDPTFMAYANTEYNTHYMNLAYAPQKALSLMLASEVFHRVPMYKDFGVYPHNTRFDAFHVSYEADLAEMATNNKFIYTNDTDTSPPTPEQLEKIAGFGNSPIVKYEGTGVYFLDKIETGVWRLEVMPDAIWVKDPFGRNSLDRQVAAINYRSWPMTIQMPDIGSDFTVKAINENNTFNPVVSGQTFSVYPGTYIIAKKGISKNVSGDLPINNIRAGEFAAPKSNLPATCVIHHPIPEITEKTEYVIEATIASVVEPGAVEVSIAQGFRPKKYPMKRVHGYNYSAVIPAEEINHGFLRYFITVRQRDGVLTFPGSREGSPSDWDFKGRDSFEVRIVPATAPVYIFNSFTDADKMSRQWRREEKLVPLGPDKAELRIHIEKLFAEDPENPKARKIHDYSMRFCFKDKIAGRRADLNNKKELILTGSSASSKPSLVQLALITKAGTVFGSVVKVEPGSGDYRISLGELKQVKLVTLPRPYPTFLPYFFQGDAQSDLKAEDIESLQISLGPGIPEDELDEPVSVAIENVRLE